MSLKSWDVPKPQKISSLELSLGYKFTAPELLHRALTHASARDSDDVSAYNERLEFLGDRVLALSVADMLFKAFPDLPEGDLAKRFNRLVRRESCFEVGEELGLGSFLRLGASESGTGGRKKTTIIANACEAVLGAIFLDGGFDAADRVIRHFWGERLDDVSETPSDPKSALQEWAQGQRLPLPKYREVARRGPDHAPKFETSVEVRGFEVAIGLGASKRAAEQAAARALLVREGVWADD